MDEFQKEAIASKNNAETNDLKLVRSFLSHGTASMQAADTLAQQSEQLSNKVLELLSTNFPLCVELPNDSEQVVAEIKFCIRLIMYCLISQNSGTIERYLIFELEENNQAFNLSENGFIAAFNYIKENHGLTDEAADATNEYIDEAIAALSQLAERKTNTTPEETIDQSSKLENPENRDILTLEEIQKQYPRQWVLIVEPELDEDLNIIRGKVLYNSPDRDEAYSKLSLRNGKLLAVEYTGTMSDDIAVML